MFRVYFILLAGTVAFDYVLYLFLLKSEFAFDFFFLWWPPYTDSLSFPFF